jgi:hypothetical protein
MDIFCIETNVFDQNSVKNEVEKTSAKYTNLQL